MAGIGENSQNLESKVRRLDAELETLKRHVRECFWAFLICSACVCAVGLAILFKQYWSGLHESLVLGGIVLFPFPFIGFLYHLIRAFLKSKEKDILSDD
jgi:hypothetical protein